MLKLDNVTLGGMRFPYFVLFKIVYCIPYLLVSSWYTAVVAVFATVLLSIMLIRMSKATGAVSTVRAELEDLRACSFLKHGLVNAALIAVHFFSPVVASVLCLAFMMLHGEFWFESPVLMLVFSKPMYKAVIRGVSVTVIGHASLMYTQLVGSVFVGR